MEFQRSVVKPSHFYLRIELLFSIVPSPLSFCRECDDDLLSLTCEALKTSILGALKSLYGSHSPSPLSSAFYVRPRRYCYSFRCYFVQRGRTGGDCSGAQRVLHFPYCLSETQRSRQLVVRSESCYRMSRCSLCAPSP